MLETQQISIKFGQGIDTKSDPKTVIAGKYLSIENAVFTKVNQIAKRNGYTAFSDTIVSHGTLSDPKLVKAYNDELIAGDQGMLLTYSSNDSSWIKKGAYTSTDIKKFGVDQEHSLSGAVDCAVLNNYALYSWSTASQQTSGFPIVNSETLASIVDMDSGSIVLGPQSLSTATASPSFINYPKCLLLGGTTLGVIYIKADASALVLRIVSFSGGGVVSFGSEVTITTNFVGTAFDAVATSTGAAIFYKSTTGVTVSTISTAGSIVNTAVIVDANAGRNQQPMHVSVTSNNNIWIYWTDTDAAPISPTNCSIVYAVYSSTLVVVQAKTTVATLSSPYFTANFISNNDSATQQTLYYATYTSYSAENNIDSTYSRTVTSAGVVGAQSLFAHGVCPYSRSFQATSNGSTNSYAVFIYRGIYIQISGDTLPANEATLFVVQLTNNLTTMPLVVGRFGFGQLSLQTTLLVTMGYLPNVAVLSATKVLFATALQVQQFPYDYFVDVQFYPGGLANAFYYTIDFDSENAYRAVNCGELAVLNGGVVQAYDGQNCNELGFHLFPEMQFTPATTVGGNLAPGNYTWIAIFQWTDAQGNLHQSAPSVVGNPVPISAPDNSCTLLVTAPALTQKSNVSVAIYRTQSNGSVYYQVTNPVFVTKVDPTTGPAITFTDTLSDAAIVRNPQAYTYPASSVLENGVLPPSMIMIAHNNRLWLVDAENPNTVWYTKSFQAGTGLSPSAFLTEQIDPKYGDITALAEMDDKIIIFKEHGIFIQAGDGATDTGSNSTLSFPQFVPSDVGCSNLKSVVSVPTGVMFQSPNGIYMLNRALGVSYVGLEVEQYNSQTYTAATVVPKVSQIRFLTDSGTTLVYDYIFNKWSTFTNHLGVSADAWNDSYVYVHSSGDIYKEMVGVYTDNGTAFALKAKLSWLALSGIQGFQRARKFNLLGDYANGASSSHGVRVSAAYDFIATYDTPISYTFGASLSSGVFQYSERFPRQKMDSISLYIEEITTGDPSEYIDLTDMSFEAGMKKGLNKMSQDKSVG